MERNEYDKCTSKLLLNQNIHHLVKFIVDGILYTYANRVFKNVL